MRWAGSMFLFSVSKLFRVLDTIPGLQRKDWERNQSGTDRAMEAVLIQRAPREVATYALVRLRIAAMPDLATTVAAETWPLGEVQQLTAWARSQGHGGAMLAKVAAEKLDRHRSCRARAALASLRYYHCRDDANPAVKDPWTEQGFDRLWSVDVDPLLEYPTRGPVWRAKVETLKRLVIHVRKLNVASLSDDAIIRSLKSVPGVGDQTAGMAALFWLGRPVPILDMYLITLLQRHGLLPGSFRSTTAARRALAEHLLDGARGIAASRSDWSAERALSCLYLWACEVGRLHCHCESRELADCPIVRGFRDPGR